MSAASSSSVASSASSSPSACRRNGCCACPSSPASSPSPSPHCDRCPLLLLRQAGYDDRSCASVVTGWDEFHRQPGGENAAAKNSQTGRQRPRRKVPRQKYETLGSCAVKEAALFGTRVESPLNLTGYCENLITANLQLTFFRHIPVIDVLKNARSL